MSSLFPDPLACTCQSYIRACREAGIKGGGVLGLERYRRLYRLADIDQELLKTHAFRPSQVQSSESGEGTVRKFTLDLPPAGEGVYDKGEVGKTLQTESVIIPMIGKKRVLSHTLCVSSQVGCAMGCHFCQTAQMGLVRNLTAGEIVRQWFAARHYVPGYQDSQPGCHTIKNIVFMGMGEPMDNLEAVLQAIETLTDDNGAGISMSKITISTVGRVDGIERLAERIHTPGWHRLNLAISLNAPNDQIREKIMPINRRYAMNELRTVLEAWPDYGTKLCLEYVLIPGVNDQHEHAVEVGDFVLGRGAYAGRKQLPGLVNVIPYNPRENSPWEAPSESQADKFLGWLTKTGVYAKRRRTKGRDQMAACGQLGNLEHRRRKLVTLGLPPSS